MAGQFAITCVYLGGERCYEGEKAQERKKENVQLQKISILPPPPPQKGLEFPGGWGCGQFCKSKYLQKLAKLNWNFQRVGGGGS